ncbi:MAG: HAMP domain-containing sensor histidine kinase [Gammaproteobacteria bacterium]|nr:HAMP domain-containing sensor histidine kinase [Gammaproteobacteria bacterium]
MLRRLRQSLFAKLTLVVLAAAVAVIIILVLAIGEAIRQGRNPQLWGPVDGFVKFTAEQIFAAPSAAAIDAAAARLGMRIRYQGPDFAYATDDSLPAFDEMRRHRHAHRRARGRGVVMDFEDGAQYLMHARPPHRILLVSALRGSQEVHAGWIIAAALGALAALFAGVHFWIRRTLSPLSDLDANLAAVGRGEWREMKTARRDEIGKLAHGFNRMQRQLREMLATRERLLAGISHELRTPLARMKVAVEFVSDARIQKRLTEDIDELDSLTGDLLESARLASKHGNLQTAPCGAAQLARDTIAQLDAAAQQYFRVQDHSAGAVIDADARRLKRALRNILDNSLKYSQLAPASIAVTIARAAGRVTITVQDRGPGLARPDLARIFDAFYRADPSRARAAATPGGYGLGMGLCRAIVEAHHGAVTAASAPGEGVRVTVELPAGRQETCHTPA